MGDRAPVGAASPDDAYDVDAEALAHVNSVYRVALWLSGIIAEAQDLTQDTYERALREREGFVRTNKDHAARRQQLCLHDHRVRISEPSSAQATAA